MLAIPLPKEQVNALRAFLLNLGRRFHHPRPGEASNLSLLVDQGLEPVPGFGNGCAAVGSNRFRIEPNMPAGLEWVAASYESVRGTIRSSWRLEEDLLYFDVEIPVNTTAVVQIPTRNPTSIREGGRSLSEVPAIRDLPATTTDAVRFELGSGRYSFTAVAP